MEQLNRLARDLDADPRRLEKLEERLFALRDLARKHNVAVDDLAALAERFDGQLARLDDRSGALAGLAKAEAQARQAYIDAAERLSAARRKTAAKLDKAVLAELAPLKLEKASFATRLERLAEPQWGATGAGSRRLRGRDQPRRGAGAHRAHRLGRRAGALPARPQGRARRARAAPPPWCSTRSTAASAAPRRPPSASGWHGSRPSAQLLVVTHSPQVAAHATHHWRVEKSSGKAGNVHRRRGPRRAGPARGDRPHALRRHRHRRGAGGGRSADRRRRRQHEEAAEGAQRRSRSTS